MLDELAVLWCKTMHSKAMWPMRGKYTCPDCLRQYPVAWEGIPDVAPTTQRKATVSPLLALWKRFVTM